MFTVILFTISVPENVPCHITDRPLPPLALSVVTIPTTAAAAVDHARDTARAVEASRGHAGTRADVQTIPVAESLLNYLYKNYRFCYKCFIYKVSNNLICTNFI